MEQQNNSQTIHRTYSELIKLPTFEERYRYLKLGGSVGSTTFGCDRYLNQIFYASPEWKMFRNNIIIRDNGCDLGIANRRIYGKLFIHHIIPITAEDIELRNPILLDPDNVISVSFETHQAIHFGDESLLMLDYVKREPNDTCPWR